MEPLGWQANCSIPLVVSQAQVRRLLLVGQILVETVFDVLLMCNGGGACMGAGIGWLGENTWATEMKPP